MIKLGSQVTEIATGLPGMVTHLQIEMDGQNYVFFQPRGLSPGDGKPIKGMWVVQSRLTGGEIIKEPNIPIEVLGTQVEDTATGFTGIATAICLHISGCVHVDVQPNGRLEKTGAPIEVCNFDIRRLKGDAIKPMTESERTADQTEKPSPAEVERYEPGFH